MNDVLAYIYDFLSIVFEDASSREKIKEVILFGSVAKKNFDKKSDIDLFFVVKTPSEAKLIESNLKKILKSFEVKAEKTWKLKGINLPINFIVGSLEDKTWENIKDEIASSGIVLYGSYRELPKNVGHYLLFYYSLINLNRKNKMRFIRRLMGYSLKKGKKEYKQKGMLEKINGLKLAQNVVLIPSEEAVPTKIFFDEFNIKYRVIDSWIRL